MLKACWHVTPWHRLQLREQLSVAFGQVQSPAGLFADRRLFPTKTDQRGSPHELGQTRQPRAFMFARAAISCRRRLAEFDLRSSPVGSSRDVAALRLSRKPSARTAGRGESGWSSSSLRIQHHTRCPGQVTGGADRTGVPGHGGRTHHAQPRSGSYDRGWCRASTSGHLRQFVCAAYRRAPLQRCFRGHAGGHCRR